MEIKAVDGAGQKGRIVVTKADIDSVKRQHIMDNLCYSLREAGQLFGKGEKWAKEKVKDGDFIAVDDKTKVSKDDGSLLPSQGIRVTAASVEAYRLKSEIAPERWSK